LRWPEYNQLNTYYGNPDKNRDGSPDVNWEIENIVRFKPPMPMIWSWSKQPVSKIAIHKKCESSLYRILEKMNKLSPDVIEKHKLYECGGAYNFRLMRGGNKLSTHSWGCAIDIAPEINVLGRKYDPRSNMIPSRVIDIFEDEGWQWGGLWGRPDGMHFQACKQ